MKFIEEFKAFALKGNVIDMAIGVIIGGAFGKIVSSLVNDIIMPPIGLLAGGINFKNLCLVIKKAHVDPATGKTIEAITLNYGNFLQTTVDFLLIALFIFLVIKFMNKLKRKKDKTPPPPAKPTKEEILLTEIRDILKDIQDKPINR